ncbi:MAG: hypothetical protein ACI4B6_05805 [Atopobiaceae bacterium]
MPSWNIHTAHVQTLLGSHDAHELGIVGVNEFLFGNYVPDVYVGYMVKNPSKVIDYRKTHFADAAFIPAPRADEFWRLYIRGDAFRDGAISDGAASDGKPVSDGRPVHDEQPREDGVAAVPWSPDQVTDVTLGAWAHLVCDHCYNLNTCHYIDSIGVAPGERTRIRKQGDFDLFGRTLDISLMPHVTDELLRQCQAFPQYSVEAPDVRAAVDVADRIVRDNALHHVDGRPDYSLLSAEFFRQTFEQVNDVLYRWLKLRAQGGNPLEDPSCSADLVVSEASR